MTRILRIDASARRDGSVTRKLTGDIVARVPDAEVTLRDLADPLPLIDEAWISASFTPAPERDDHERARLELSETLIAEIRDADLIVIGLPIYNFGPPAAFKAWVDLVARAGVTFRYTEAGPEGLIRGKRAIVAVASGGTEMGSEIDFATGYVRHVLGFIGIDDVVFVRADRMMIDANASLAAAAREIDALDIAA